MSDWLARKALKKAQEKADRLPGGSDYKRFVLLNDAITTFLAECEKDDYIPTKRGRFCNQAGAMGNGCSDSWWSGGNYGSSLCRNPAHHDLPGCDCLVDGACAQATGGGKQYRCRRDHGSDEIAG